LYSPVVEEILPDKVPVVVAVDSDVVCVEPSFSPETAAKENPGAVDVPAVPRGRPVDAVIPLAVAAGVVANPDNDPMIRVAELAAGTLSVIPVPAVVAAVPPNLNPLPRDSPLVVVVTAVAPRVSPEVGLQPVSVSPGEAEEAGVVVGAGAVNVGVGFTVAGAGVSFASSVKLCNGAETNPLA